MISQKGLRLVAWIWLAMYVCVLLTLTHIPKVPSVFTHTDDKSLHFTAYLLLAGLTYFALGNTLVRFRSYVPILTILVCITFGAMDEITQPPFGRTADILDWRADAMGALTSVLVMTIFVTIARFTRKNRANNQ